MADNRNEIFNYTSNDVNYGIYVHYILSDFLYLNSLLRTRNSKKYQKLKEKHAQNQRLLSHLCPGDLY
jgi:hypothetical protein